MIQRSTRRIRVSVDFLEDILKRGTVAVAPTNVPPDFMIHAVTFLKKDRLVDLQVSSGHWHGGWKSLSKSPGFIPDMRPIAGHVAAPLELVQ